ncbi:MAG: hypothetical protein WC497_06225 [Patescibacteria group bacterium]
MPYLYVWLTRGIFLKNGFVIRGLRKQGMTLQKIAMAMGVSVDTVHRAVFDSSFPKSEITNERGQSRPSHYATHDENTPRPHVANNTGETGAAGDYRII